MRQEGFSLIEMLVVMAIIGVLLGIATLNYNDMQKKAAIEGQVKTMYADLMNARVQALYTKRTRSIIISGNLFKFYSSSETSVAPESQKSFSYPMATNLPGNMVTFNTSGLVSGSAGSICIDPFSDLSKANPGGMDSLVISTARINMGKRRLGGTCDSAHIDQQ
jgi:type IV fimbrial biogenesis protein FimT